MQLTAADRMLEPGDVVRRKVTGSVWKVCFAYADHIGMENGNGNAFNYVASVHWGGLEYVSRVDSGPVTKEG